MVSVLNNQRDQLDLATRFCLIFILATLISAIVLWQYGWWMVVPAFTLLLAWLSYQSALAAAVSFGESVRSAFDLYRFDLIRAFHLPLPTNLKAEREAYKDLNLFFRQQIETVDFQYIHEKP